VEREALQASCVRDRSSQQGRFAMTRHPIRQGRDRQAEEDFEKYLSRLYQKSEGDHPRHSARVDKWMKGQ